MFTEHPSVCDGSLNNTNIKVSFLHNSHLFLMNLSMNPYDELQTYITCSLCKSHCLFEIKGKFGKK